MTIATNHLKVIGLGGGGSNAVNRMLDLGFEGVEFIAANTDMQALKQSRAAKKILLGPQFTRGLGAGGRPEVGYEAATESKDELKAALAGADLVFLTAGMGGGTGTGAIAVAAEAAQAVGALTVAIVTTPFGFEATRRYKNAEWGLERLRANVDTLITVSNDKLLTLLNKNVRLDVSFRVADEVLRQGVQGITELINRPGLINVDFAHVRRIMHGSGNAMLAIGQGRGEQKAEAAIQQALKMPLLDAPNLQRARGILVHFTGGDDLGLFEVSRAADQLRQAAPDAEIVFGTAFDDTLKGRAQVILIVTGFDAAPPVLPKVAQPVAVETALPLHTVRPTPARKPEALPAASTHLAEALFSRALTPTEDGQDEQMFVTAPPAANPNSLDIPAFLRRRRTMRDIEQGK
jgi:cell division protein FtsZ